MNFLLDNIFLVGIAIVSGLALLIPALQPRANRASTLQVTQMINRGKSVVVDVRTAEEFAKGHLRDAKHIPCQSGNRADKAVKQFLAAGFTEVVSLEGGIAAWEAAGLPTVSTTASVNLKK